VLVFVRELAHPPSRVWKALTLPQQLRAWAPFDADRDLSRTGPATLDMAGGDAPVPLPSMVLQADAPKLLEYTWGDDVLRWELEPTERGTRLTLRHSMEDRSFVPKTAAGWQICLDVAEAALSGEPIGRIVASDALNFGWQRLNDAYAAAFGIENTGLPDELKKT
jgi:uncharacterized protein YndB with AHSA1/START domain